MDLAVFEVMQTAYFVAIVGILITEQTYVLADRLRILCPQCHGATVVCLVVIQRVLDRQILQVDILSHQIECRRVIDRLRAIVRCILEDHTITRLTNDGDILLADLCQHALA